MTLETQMKLALLQELLMALREMTLIATRVGLPLALKSLVGMSAGEVESDWMVPLLLEEERDRLMAWQLGVDL